MPCQWQGIRSFSRRRKPQGKGRAAKSAILIRARLPGRARNAPANGQAGASGFGAGQIRENRKGAPE